MKKKSNMKNILWKIMVKAKYLITAVLSLDKALQKNENKDSFQEFSIGIQFYLK